MSASGSERGPPPDPAVDSDVLNNLLNLNDAIIPTTTSAIENKNATLPVAYDAITAVRQLPASADDFANHLVVLRAIFKGMRSHEAFEPLPFLTTLTDDNLRTILRKNRGFAGAISRFIALAGPSGAFLMLHDALEKVLQYVCYEPESESVNPIDLKAALDAWNARVRGSAHFALLSALRHDHAVNNQDNHRDEHYSNNVTMLQGSGTGKSRNVSEMSNYTLVFPTVLRPAKDASGFPRPDIAVRNFLVVPPGATLSEQGYRIRIRVFLRLVFLSIATWLRNQVPPATPREYAHVAEHWQYLYKVTAWREFLDRNRVDAYKQIIAQAEQTCAGPGDDDKGPTAVKNALTALVRILKGASLSGPPSTALEGSQGIVPLAFKSKLTAGHVDTIIGSTNNACKTAKIADPKASLLACPDFSLASTDLLVLLSFDEAQGLTESRLPYAFPGAIPTTSDGSAPDLSPLRSKSAYDIILSELNELRSQVVGVFLSTSTKIAQFAPPPALASSARQSISKRLQAPITELPFDCFLEKPLQVSDLRLNVLSSIPFMAKFGRPFFGSFVESMADDPDMSDEEKQEREIGLINLVRAKLAGTSEHASFAATIKKRPNADKAVLDVRLCMEYEPRRSSVLDSVQADLLAEHFREAYSVPAHRLFFHSGYPSEPITGEAAALLMRDWMPGLEVQDDQERSACWNPLDTLVDMMKSNLIALGERGELIARLLLTFAYDRAMHLSYPHERVGSPGLPFSRGCPVLEFLKALFGVSNAANLCTSTPDNIPSEVSLSSAFANARVRFTHFVRLGDSSGLTTRALCAAFVRGMAFICKIGQERVDLIVPVLLDADGPISPGNMTAFLIQVKRRVKPGQPNKTDYTAEELHVFDDSDDAPDPVARDLRRARPYCTLLMELAAGMPANLRSQDPPPPRRPPPRADPVAPATPQRATSVTKPFTPSGIFARKGPTRGSERVEQPHPRYNIKAYGCSHSVYGGVIAPDNNSGWGKAKYTMLLATQTVFNEHPRKSLLSLVWQMKPQWVCNALYNSYHWINVKVAEEPVPSEDESRHGVQAMQYVE